MPLIVASWLALHVRTVAQRPDRPKTLTICRKFSDSRSLHITSLAIELFRGIWIALPKVYADLMLSLLLSPSLPAKDYFRVQKLSFLASLAAVLPSKPQAQRHLFFFSFYLIYQ